jgi:hypothetical protein
VLRHCRAVIAHNGVLSICVRPRYQRRGRHGLLSDSNHESEAGHKNKQFLKGDGLHADSIGATLSSFKMPYRHRSRCHTDISNYSCCLEYCDSIFSIITELYQFNYYILSCLDRVSKNGSEK